jgi:glycine/serine hydroxymethyltransferase
MGEAEMREVAVLVAEVLQAPEDEGVRTRVRKSVEELTARFPLYAERLPAPVSQTV